MANSLSRIHVTSRCIVLIISLAAIATTSRALATEPEKQKIPEVARAQFTTRIEDREPTDAIERLSDDRTRILFYSELRGLAGETIRHRWEREGQPMAEVPFHVKANRWRVWSSKNLEPDGLGTWTVSVITQDGTVLASRSFIYHEK